MYDELKVWLSENGLKNNKVKISISNTWPLSKRNELINATSFLLGSPKINERIYCILNDIDTLPICICGKPTSKFHHEKLRKSCSASCAGKMSNDARIATNIIKYGGKSALADKDVLARRNDNMMKKYGVTHASQLSKNKVKSYIPNKLETVDQSNLKDWISKNCMTSTEELNSSISVVSWWTNRNFTDRLDEIFHLTKFIDSDNITERIFHVMNDTTEIFKCVVCNKNCNFMQYKSGYHRHCSVECSWISEERLNKIKENTDYTQTAATLRKTNLSRYGVDSYYKTVEFKEKARQTKLRLYGDPNYNNQAKNEANNYKKYGMKSRFCDPKFQELCRTIRIEKYGSLCPTLQGSESKAEIEVRTFLNSLSKHEFKKNRKLLKRYEIDAYSDELKLGIEYCGNFWHSEKYRDKKYHHTKWKMCKELNVELVTIFEDEWLLKNKQVKSFLSAKLGIFEKRISASKCKFVCLNKPYGFFDENHIQGKPNNITLAFGLIYQNEIVGAVSFAPHHRDAHRDVLALNRLAFKSGIQIIGGSSKLIKNALKNIDQPVVTWSDSRWSTGKIYEKIGFKFDEYMRPDYSYYVPNQTHRSSKQSMQKSKIGCPTEMTEREFLMKKNIYRIYDCGKIRWIYNKETT